MLLPCMERGCETTCISDVFAQSQPAVDMEDFVAGAFDSKGRILIHETLRSFLEGLDGVVIPPVRVVSGLVVVPTGGVECWSRLAMLVDGR